MARTDFILPTTQWFVPHGSNQCSLCLMVRLSFILIIGWFAPDSDIDILSPHGNNWSSPGNIIIYSALPLRLSGDIKRTSHWARHPIVFFFLELLGLLISVGVAFLVTPCKRAFCISPALTQGFRASVLVLLLLWRHLTSCPFVSSLMLIQRCCSLALVLLFLQRQATIGFWHLFWCFLKAFVHLWWCPFGCDPLDEWPLVSLLTLTH